MPAFLLPAMAFITRFLSTFVTASFLVPLITRVCIYFGVSAVTYTGVGLAISTITSNLANGANGLPSGALAVLQIMKIPNAANLILSSIVASLTIRGLSSAGSMTKLALTPNKGQDVFSGLGNTQTL